MALPKRKVAKPRPLKKKGAGVDMVQLSLPTPLPDGVSVVYDKGQADVFIQTASSKATSALLSALWAGVKQ